MSDQAATQDTGTANVKPVKDTWSAVDAVERMLDLEPGTQPEKPQSDEATHDAAGDGSGEELRTETLDGEAPEGDQPEEGDTGSEQEASQEADGDAVELPGSLAELTEALGVDPDALMNIKATVKVDGKPVEVTLNEALRGYQREADYTQKTEAFAEQRKAFQAHAQQAQVEFQQKGQAIDTMIDALATELRAGPSEQDLAGLLAEGNIPEYIRLKEEIETKQRRLGQFQQARGQQLQQQQHEQLRQLGEYRQSQQQALLKLFPGIDDPAKGNVLQARAEKVLEGFGFSKEELKSYMQGAFDHRLIRVAIRLDELMQQRDKGAAAVKKIAAKPKLLKPGAAKGKRGAAEKQQELRNRLRRHGDRARKGVRNRTEATKDAVDFVESFL